MEKISITTIISNTFIIPWNNLFFYSQVLAVPVLILTTVWAIWITLAPYSHIISYVAFFVYSSAFAYLAITCHKLILTQDKTVKELISIDIKLFIRFIILAAIIYIMSTIVKFAIINIYVGFFGEANNTDSAIEIAEYVAYLPSMYVIGRFCIVFPAIALGYKPTLKWAWKATRQNHLQILFIVALFPWALEIIIYSLYRENATLIEQSLLTFLTYISAILGVFAISLTYKALYLIEQKKL
ncbi:MAG: hypothetical protein OEZ15_02145 [Gammaproteobacteria bacterium]|nr:hypothetical protein [Gammaproteobacteria bacterium]